MVSGIPFSMQDPYVNVVFRALRTWNMETETHRYRREDHEHRCKCNPRTAHGVPIHIHLSAAFQRPEVVLMKYSCYSAKDRGWKMRGTPLGPRGFLLPESYSQ